MKERDVESTFAKQDLTFEVPLRPQTLSEFIGQDEVKERLNVLIKAAKLRGEPLGHVLLSGPPGLGKTTLAQIIAKTMESAIIISSGPALEKAADLAGILTNLNEGDILFIDEIHRLSSQVEEYLYQAIEDFSLDIMIDSGPAARSVQVKLNKFTLLGATTRAGLLTSPLRSRFQFHSRLDYYPTNDLQKILARSSKILRFNIDEEGLGEIAARSRGTPRIANNLLKWTRDFTVVRGESVATKKVVTSALTMLSIDDKGLDEMDKKILDVIIDHYGGGPVGLNTIAVAIGELGETIEEVHEPFLILQGFIKRSPRGRIATPQAFAHLGKKMK